MDEIEFICFFNRLQKLLNVSVDSDIVAIIYKEYIRKYYEKYTLWQLLSMLDKRGLYVSCKHTKKHVVNLISDSDIPCEKHWYDIAERTEWQLYNMKYIDYLTSTFARHVSANIICIMNAGSRTEIMCNDIFYLFNKEYRIISISKNTISLKCKEDNNHIAMPISEFIHTLDTDENAGIYYNYFRSTNNKIDSTFYTTIQII
jgi:hypothetical protein